MTKRKSAAVFLMLIAPPFSGLAEEHVAPSPPAAAVAYENGFVLKSGDGRFAMKIGGYVQAQFDGMIREGAPDTDTFRVPRARIFFAGHAFSPEVRYQILYEMASNSLLVGLLEYAVSDSFILQGGQFRVPFNFEGPMSSARLQFVDRSIAQAAFGVASIWEPGLGIHGRLGGDRFVYEVGAFNGEGRNTLNANSALRYAGRFTYNAVGRFGSDSVSDIHRSESPHIALAAAAMFNDTPDASGTATKTLSFTTEFNAKYGGLGTHNAFFFKHTKPETKTSAKDYGLLVSGGYMFVPQKWEIAARMAKVFNDAANDESEYTLGLNRYFFGGGFGVKLQADVSVLTEKDGVALGNDRVDYRGRVFAQISL